MNTINKNFTEKPDSWINQFPFPIAYSFRIMQNTTEEHAKFSRLIDLYECILKYNTIILISDYIKNKKNEANIDYLINKYRPSIGHWYNIFQAIIIFFKKENIKPFIPRLLPFYFNPDGSFTKDKELMERIIGIRNKNKGHGITLSLRDYKNLADELYPLITTLLDNLAFLKDYKLICINNISYNGEKFFFNISNCMGSYPEFKKEIIHAEIPLPDHQLILYSTIPNNISADLKTEDSKQMGFDKFLTIHPYLILHECIQCSKDEIFFFEANLDNRKIEYLSYQYGHRIQTEEYNNDFKKILVNITVDKDKLEYEGPKIIKKLPPETDQPIINRLIRWSFIGFFIIFSIFILFKYYTSEKPKNETAEIFVSPDLQYLKIYDFSKTYKKLIDSLGKDPQDIMTYFDIGMLYEENGWLKASLEQYKKVIGIDPNFILAKKKTEELSNKINNFNIMIRDYEYYIKSPMQNLNLTSDIAYKFFQLGDFSLSITEYEKLLSVTTDNFDAWQNLSLSFTLQGKYSKAIDILNKAKNYFPNSEKLCYYLGVNYELSAKEESAIDSYTQATKLNPKFAPTYYSLSEVYNDKKEKKKAIDNLNIFISSSSDREWIDKAKIKLAILQKED